MGRDATSTYVEPQYGYVSPMQGWQCPACARIWSPFFSGPCPCSQAGAFEPYRITCDGGTTTDPADTTTDVTNAPVTPTAWLTNLRER